MSIKEKLQALGKNSIELKISEEEEYKRGATRFGGQPDVPPDFEWPTYIGENYDHIVKDRPLSFLVQLNCAELAQYDTEHLLPDHGLLSFFYEMDTECWGYELGDKGCAHVYWFEDTSNLSAAEFPEDMEWYFRFPMIKIKLSQKISYPSWEDFYAMFPNGENDYSKVKEAWDEFDAAWEELIGENMEESDERSQLLGWPDVIQNSMYEECDLVTQGYTTGSLEGWNEIPNEIRQQAEKTAHDRWMLLLQLDTVECGDFELMFGDGGHIYFYITKEDLAARRFDRIWLVLQCC